MGLGYDYQKCFSFLLFLLLPLIWYNKARGCWSQEKGLPQCDSLVFSLRNFVGLCKENALGISPWLQLLSSCPCQSHKRVFSWLLPGEPGRFLEIKPTKVCGSFKTATHRSLCQSPWPTLSLQQFIKIAFLVFPLVHGPGGFYFRWADVSCNSGFICLSRLWDGSFLWNLSSLLGSRKVIFSLLSFLLVVRIIRATTSKLFTRWSWNPLFQIWTIFLKFLCVSSQITGDEK